jgi:S-adenosylmethionine decarboxylase proenzyme
MIPRQRPPRTVATHHLVEFSGCDPEALNSPRVLTAALKRLCADAPLSPVRKIQHHFSPYGLTLVVILRESHFAFHSWPEYGYAAVDVFLCGEVPGLIKALAVFGTAIGAAGAQRARVRRGPGPSPSPRGRSRSSRAGTR